MVIHCWAIVLSVRGVDTADVVFDGATVERGQGFLALHCHSVCTLVSIVVLRSRLQTASFRSLLPVRILDIADDSGLDDGDFVEFGALRTGALALNDQLDVPDCLAALAAWLLVRVLLDIERIRRLVRLRSVVRHYELLALFERRRCDPMGQVRIAQALHPIRI